MQRVAYHVVSSSLTFMLLFAGVEAWRMGSLLGADSTSCPTDSQRVAPRRDSHMRSRCGERYARGRAWAASASTRYTFTRVSEREVSRSGAASCVETVYAADDGRRVTHRVERFATTEGVSAALRTHVNGASFPIETRPYAGEAGAGRGSRVMLFYGIPQVERSWFEFVWTEDGSTLETIEGPTYVHASQFDRVLQSGEIR